jgi:hypothetical protein
MAYTHTTRHILTLGIKNSVLGPTVSVENKTGMGDFLVKIFFRTEFCVEIVETKLTAKFFAWMSMKF